MRVLLSLAYQLYVDNKTLFNLFSSLVDHVFNSSRLSGLLGTNSAEFIASVQDMLDSLEDTIEDMIA